jgi:GntR family transcriptional regulator
MSEWNDSQPIFRQIRNRIAGMILSGAVGEGEALPSVRAIAADLSVNPLTVGRAYDMLVALGVVETRRGLGMFVAHGAGVRLLAHERKAFLEEEWPLIRARILMLKLDPADLFEQGPKP